MARRTAAPVLSNEELARLMGLIREADSVELKLSIPEPHQAPTIDALGLDPLDAQIRQVYFFDTPDLTLDRAGLVVRARRVQRKGDDSVVKLRPVIPGELPADLRTSPAFVVEVDALPGGFVCSGSLKGVPRGTTVRDTVLGGHPPNRLFSKEQRRLYTAHAPDGIALDDLTVLGPIVVMKLKFSPEELGRNLVAELWFYPDGSRILELSTRCMPSEAFQVAMEVRVFLYDKGVDVSGEQETKTRKALEFFASRLSRETP